MVKGLGRDQYDIRCKEKRVPVRAGHVKIPLCVKAYPLDVYAPDNVQRSRGLNLCSTAPSKSRTAIMADPLREL